MRLSWILVSALLFWSLLSFSLTVVGAAVENSVENEESQGSAVPKPLDDKDKAKLDRLISVSIDMRGNSKNMDEEDLSDGRGGEHVYMATYDATNVAKQWQNMGILHDTQAQHKLISDISVEKEKFLPKDASPSSEKAPPTEPGGPSISEETSIDSAKEVDSQAHVDEQPQEQAAETEAQTETEPSTEAAQETFEPAPEPTDEEKAEMKQRVEPKLAASTFQELTPFNVMHFVHHHQPFLMINLCDCWRDATIVDHLQEAESLLTAKGLLAQITKLYIKPDTIAKFRLQEVYQMNEKVTTLYGSSTTKSSTRRIFFGVELDRTPSKEDFEVEIVDECCGDHFSLSVGQITNEWAEITIERTDEGQNDWGQELKLSWRILKKPHYQVPLVVIDNIPLGSNNEKFIYQPHEWENDQTTRSQGLASYVEGFLLKNDMPKLLVRSQPLQISPPPAEHVPGTVMDLIGHNFKDVVSDPAKDVLLMIYSPNCGASMAIMPLFEQAAEALVEDSNVVVARIDKTRNDLNLRGIGVYYYPTVYLFPAGEGDKVERKLDFSDFNGSKELHDKTKPHSHFSLQLITNFVREHGGSYNQYLAPPVSAANPQK